MTVLRAGAVFAVSVGAGMAVTAARADDEEALRRFLYFSDAHVAFNQQYSTYGTRFAPLSSIDETGPIVSITFSSGKFRYRKKMRAPIGRRPRKKLIRTVDFGGGLAAGYQLVKPRYGVALLVGGLADYRLLMRRDPTNDDTGFRPALAVMAEGWAKPIPNLLVTAYAEAKTRHHATYGKLFAGLEVDEEVFVGPEIGFSRDDYGTERFTGFGFLGVKTGPFRVKATFGVVDDGSRKNANYLSVVAWRRF